MIAGIDSLWYNLHMSAETSLPPQDPLSRPLHERVIAAFQERLFPGHFEDELTGLGNRAAFNQELGRKIRRQPGEFTLLEIDLNDLKEENDQHGHAAGDHLIQRAGTIINSSIRAEDEHATPHTQERRHDSGESEADQLFTTRRRWLGRLARPDALNRVFRWGGDEYKVILSGVNDPRVVATVMERIAGNLARDEKKISASIGFAIHEPGMNGATLCSEADASMYAAKRRHKRQQRQEEIDAQPPYRRAIYHAGEFLTRISGIGDRRR